MSFFSSQNSALSQPPIKKGIFIIPPKKTYEIEFDSNIKIKELKVLIAKAARLKNVPFRLFSEGKEFTKLDGSIFETLFPNKSTIIFTVEPYNGFGNVEENELAIKMNSTCLNHPDKFLLYYCYRCNASICNECFTEGVHKNHLIKDKCYYLLPSGFLAEETFEKYNKKAFGEIMISEDLTQFKREVNEIMFENIFNMIKQIKDNFNSLIDNYNNFNHTSLLDIKDSIKVMKTSLINYLNNLKESLKIEDIVDNPQIFTAFDSNYMKMGKLLNDKIEEKIFNIRKVKEEVSSSIIKKIKKIYSSLKESLNNCKIEDDAIFRNGNNSSTDINNIKIVRPENSAFRGFRNTINNMDSNFNSNFGGIFKVNEGITGSRLSAQLPRKDNFDINSLDIDDVSGLLEGFNNTAKMSNNQNIFPSFYQIENENNNNN